MTFNRLSPLTSEIAFSQVREDPNIEQRVVQHLAQRQNRPLRVLLVASGGCTALSLLAVPAIAYIEAVDLNPAQPHLVELRRQALLHLTPAEQMTLIGSAINSAIAPQSPAATDTLEMNTLDIKPVRELEWKPPSGELPLQLPHESPHESMDALGKERLDLYQRLRSFLPDDSRSFWDRQPQQLAFGVNHSGRFEALFRELAAQFRAAGLDPRQRPLEAVTAPEWRAIFETVFERNKLARIFGEAAVSYSMDRSFGEHFADVFAQVLQRPSPAENYFVAQVWAERYVTGRDGTPPYLQPTVQTAIRQLGAERLTLHCGEFVATLSQRTAAERFDLIQFSNLSDWMPQADLQQMLATAIRCLRPGGALIGRRLNGDHHLATVMAEQIQVDSSLSAELLAADRSFFYREVVVSFRD